ncbi:MAG TPA: ferritin-like domain-containing protein [Solirubrobacterales bacterium]|nr:ferritin-like domain-containing protein [Solirubrobacterales bacterium]
MPSNRIMRGRPLRRALLLACILAGLATGLISCAGGGGDSTTDKAGDVRVLNQLLARQLAAVEVYESVVLVLHGEDLAVARTFLAQEQEHVDATTKTLRGLDAEADPPKETIEFGRLGGRDEVIELLYEMESATIDAELHAVGQLTIGWPRPLVASMAANGAQRLVLIRRALGAKPLETIPEAFETGETAAPEGMMGK